MKKYLLLAALALGGWELVYTCGGWDSPYTHYAFLDHKSLVDSNAINIMRSVNAFPVRDLPFFITVYDWEREIPDPNISAWQSELGNKVAMEDLSHVIYSMKLDKLEKVQGLVQKGRQVKDSDYYSEEDWYSKPSPWVNSWTKADLPYIDYLILAKQCEVYANANDYYGSWDPDWKDPRKDVKKMKLLAETAERQWERMGKGSAFLRQRYALQALRMWRYSGDAKRALAAYDKMFGDKAQTAYNYVDYLALEHKAGLLYELKRPAEGAYLFAQLFELVPYRRQGNLMSFQVHNQKDWQATLKLCQNKDEQALLYTLRGIRPNGYALEEMREIAKLDPQSKYLDWLRLVQLNRLEVLNFNQSTWAKAENLENVPKAAEMEALLALCQEVRPKLPAARQPSWQITEAMLLIGLRRQAEAELLLKPLLQHPQWGKQARLLSFLSKVNGLERLNEAEETFLAERFLKEPEFFEHPQVHAYMMQRMEQVYLKQNEQTKAFLCRHTIANLRNTGDAILLKEVEKAVIQLPKSSLLKLIFFKQGDTESIMDELKSVRSDYHLQRGQWDEAIQQASQIRVQYWNRPEEKNRGYSGQVFTLYNWYYFNGNQPEVSAADKALLKKHGLEGVNSRLALLKGLKKLAEGARGQGEEAAEQAYLLGCALNNLGPYGVHRQLMYSRTEPSAYWSPSNQDTSKRGIDPTWGGWGDEPLFYQPKLAETLFEQTLRGSKNQELRARACFAAAQAQQFRYYLEETEVSYYSYNDVPVAQRPAKYRTYFKRLQTEFAGTQFEQEIIRECSYYNDFIN